MRSNLNINLNELTGPQSRSNRRLLSANPANRTIAEGPQLTEQNKLLFDQLSDVKGSSAKKPRPMSAYSRGTSNSRITNLPEVSRVKLVAVANDIYKNRPAISELQRL